MLIYVHAPLKPANKAQLRSSLSDHELVFSDELENENEKSTAIQKAEVIFGNPKPELLQQAAHAKWVQLHSAGFEAYQQLRLQAKFTNMQDYYSQPCAETIIAGIMALYRGIGKFTLLKETKTWVGAAARMDLQLLEHKKILILGNGTIAKRMARVFTAFDAEVVFFARTPAGHTINSTEALLAKIPWADIIACCLPGTAQTRGLFTTEMIRSMHNRCIFCNVGRGSLLADEHALADALIEHRIGGAVLDVTASEPIPQQSRLWECPNTILTQHSGGGQAAEYEGYTDFFLRNIQHYLQGKPLENSIELTKGY